MKLKPLLFSLPLALSLLATPAYALEYTFDGPPQDTFGETTSVEGYTWENPNVDKSRDAALIPPGFGTPTSYLPGSGDYLTPNLAPGGGNSAGTVGGGTVIYPGAVSASAESYPTVGYPTTGSSTPKYTEVTSDLYYSGGSLGTLTIPSIGVNTKIYEGTSTASMAKGAAHFETTSIWDGNVCLAGHNRGTNEIFGKIHTLNVGDTITLTTKLGTRTYAVVSVEKILETDTRGTAATSGNRVTLYTCVMNEREYRWCVTATEVS